MRFLSVCSGIEAASVAWESLGWEAIGFSEIEPFSSSVLKHHFPEVPNYGDIQSFRSWPISRGSIDLLVGGTPCQSFSIAGLRGGLADSRGSLTLTYLQMADYHRPRWIVWENVPGVLSSNGGRDFGAFIGGLAHIGYQFAWRVLDAQYFGVPQRRRRVFVVGHSGDWRSAAEVLFEPEGVQRDFAKGKKSRKDITGSTGDGLARCLTTGEAKRQDWETCTLIATSQHGNVAGVLTARHNSSPCADRGMNVLAFNARQDPNSWYNRTGPLDTDGGTQAVLPEKRVRRLTPRECERLQGFPDDWTHVLHRGKPAADGPRYKAIGNSMAVPVMRWLGERIQKIETMKFKVGD